MSDTKRAIITGATGMLGVALTNHLVAEGYEVVAIVRPGSKRIENVPASDKVAVVELALADLDRLPACLLASGIDGADLFFHFAWDGTFGDNRNNMDIQIDNIRYTISAVRAAKAIGCECFLGAGSQAEYGRVADGTKLSASTPTNPENGYGIGKLCAGKMSRIEASKLGIKHMG